MSEQPQVGETAIIAANLADLRRRIRDAAAHRDVDIVAVSKGQPVTAIRAAVGAGLKMFGENYADELVEKATHPSLAGLGIRWTYQGRLQTNKINRLVPHVSLWQTVDTVERAQALARRAPGATVLIQINITGDGQRSGMAATQASAVIEASRLVGLDVVGIMGVGHDPNTPGVSADDCRRAFSDAVSVANDHGLVIRSLGMSSDFELALQAGATMVRIGSLLFGPRA